jgi:hypothetical protein
MTDHRAQLVENHGEFVVEAYESYFPNQLELFDDRYCGYVGELETWAQECLDCCYEGFDDEEIPSLESFIDFEFADHYVYDDELGIGFLNTQQ